MTFSRDNTVLYVGEQAVDGFIYCYDLTTDKPTLRWKYRTADDIETSTPTNPDSVYAWVSYPGPSCMRTLANGDLLVASVHSWTENNTPLKKSQLYRFNGKTGDVIWKWTREGTVPTVMRWFDVSADGKTLALLTDSGHNLQGVQRMKAMLATGSFLSSTQKMEQKSGTWILNRCASISRRSHSGEVSACLPTVSSST